MFHRVSYEHQIKEKISISDQTHLRLYNCYRDVHKACIVLHANFLFLIPRSEFHASSCVDPTSSYVNDLNLLILTQRRAGYTRCHFTIKNPMQWSVIGGAPKSARATLLQHKYKPGKAQSLLFYTIIDRTKRKYHIGSKVITSFSTLL